MCVACDANETRSVLMRNLMLFAETGHWAETESIRRGLTLSAENIDIRGYLIDAEQIDAKEKALILMMILV